MDISTKLIFIPRKYTVHVSGIEIERVCQSLFSLFVDFLSEHCHTSIKADASTQQLIYGLCVGVICPLSKSFKDLFNFKEACFERKLYYQHKEIAEFPG